MNNRFMVSVIVPVYNVSDYIERCALSIFGQTYQNLEVIFVDDCSTDNSISIIEKIYREENSNISCRIIRREHNSGQSCCRNVGIQECIGDLIFFLDSDDYITKDCIEVLVDNYQEDIDMVMGSFDQIGGYQPMGVFLEPGIYDNNIIEYSCQFKIYSMVWNKLFRRDFILSHHLFFEEGLYHEDNLWSLEAACFMKKISVVSNVTYHYQIRESSTQRNQSYDFHYVNLSTVLIKTIHFIFKNKLDNNVALFQLIRKDVNRFFNEPLWLNKPELSIEFYHKLHEASYWSALQLFVFKAPFPEMLLLLHRYLPESVGFKYYRKILMWFTGQVTQEKKDRLSKKTFVCTVESAPEWKNFVYGLTLRQMMKSDVV